MDVSHTFQYSNLPFNAVLNDVDAQEQRNYEYDKYEHLKRHTYCFPGITGVGQLTLLLTALKAMNGNYFSNITLQFNVRNLKYQYLLFLGGGRV